MATPKFDRMSVALSRLIADPVSAAGDAGSVLTANERNLYISRAMLLLFNEIWVKSGGDVFLFAGICPELLREQAVTTTSGGTYSIIGGSNMRDYYAMVSGIISTTYIGLKPAGWLHLYKSSYNADIIPTAADPVMIEAEGIVYFFPAASFNAQSVTLQFVKQPVEPSNGNLLSQNGTTDSPFKDHWEDKIINIAQQLFLKEAQETT